MTKKKLNHILIIEDDPGVAESLSLALENEGYKVSWKSQGSDGISFLKTNNPHLILLDVRLPDGSGFDFCRQMRNLGFNQPIIMLTVQNEELDKVLGLEMGADDYMTKPFSLRELLSRIRANLRRTYGELSKGNSSMLYAGEFVIDLQRALVKRGKTPINLTPLEFRLLVYLTRNAGQVLSREQILDRVWGFEANVENQKTVNVHIRRLREKVETEPGTPTLILTVPGLGYRLSAEGG